MKLLKNLIGILIVIAGFVTMIGLSLYLLVSGIIYLVQNGSSLSAGDIAWEVVVIIFRDVLSVAVGIIMMFVGLAIVKVGSNKKSKLSSALGGKKSKFQERLEEMQSKAKAKAEE